jgi:hypothetical protein
MASRPALAATSDHVLGSFPRSALSDALVAMHRAGFGPQTRVFDGVRDDVARQIERAGLRVDGDAVLPADDIVIVVTAPGRTSQVAALFARLGAESILYAARSPSTAQTTTPPPILEPDIRLGDDGGAASQP